MPEVLDVVRLCEPVGGWPVGTEGTLLEAYAEGGIVEVDDDEGRTLDLVTVAYREIEVVATVADNELVG